MNRFALLILLLFFSFSGFARHLKGGFFTYTYLGKTASTIDYRITLTVYMECNATGNQIDPNVPFTFFDAKTGAQVQNITVPISSQYFLEKTADEKCISGDQRGCYYKIVIYDLAIISLPLNNDGYIVSYQRCCRINDINNVENSGSIGNTYSITIPGNSVAANAETNKSARFEINDTIVICGSSKLNYSFSAVDPDGDVLRYEFCNAWVGGAPSPTKS